MLLFHGTRRHRPEEIVRDGLQPKSPIDVRDAVLAELGLSLEDVPEWTWKHEVAFREEQPHGIYLTTSAEQAAGYSNMGGEMAYNMRVAMLTALKGGARRDHDAAAMNGNGSQRVVVAVEIDCPELEKELHRIETIAMDRDMKDFTPTLNHIVDEIRPEQIVSSATCS